MSNSKFSDSKFSEKKTHSRHNYLNTQKSNAHTKVNKQLVQLWFGSASVISNLSDSNYLEVAGVKLLNSSFKQHFKQHFKQLSQSLNSGMQSTLPGKPLLLAVCISAFSTNVYALSQPVTNITTYTQLSTSSSYVGANDGLTYNWGSGTETVLDTLTTVNGTYSPSAVADNVIVRRVDNANVTGTRCRLFAEKTTNDQSLAASHSCDAAAIMSGRVINRGWLDVFANDPEDGNIERVDFLYTQGLQAPAVTTDLQNTGHIVTEKSGNNPVVMAAITSVDVNGNPLTYAPLVKVWPSSSAEPIRYGIATASVPFSFLRDGPTPATQNGKPENVGSSNEALGIALVTLDDLGIAENQTYYGFSYFSQDIYDAATANKVVAGIDPVDYANFPTNTSGGGSVGDADMYGGVASYFTLQKTLSGKAFDDQNTGLANITVNLYPDLNGNNQLDSGEALVATTETDASGDYSFNLGSNADYIVVIDNADADVPAGMTANTSTLAVSVGSTNVGNQDFPFTPANTAPVGVDDTATTNEETLVNIPVVSNDNDADAGDTLTPTNITAPGNGTAVLNADGVTVDYTPNANFTGTDTFTYTPNDGTTDGAVVTVTVTVDPVNDAPVGVDDTATTDEETLVNIPVVTNDNDADAGDALTPTNITAPGNGTAVINADGITIDYTPSANFTGTDTFTYTPNDGTTDGAIVTVTVTVDPVNDVPVGVDDTATTDEETLVNIPVVSNDNDADTGDTLTPTNITAPTNGTAVLNADGVTIDYTPNANFTGTDTFTYTPNDGTTDGAVVTVTVTVGGVNDAPVGVDDIATTDEETLVNIPVVSNDNDADVGDTLTPTNITAPSNGAAVLNADGVTVDYTPNANFTGTDTFTYTPNDGTTDGAIVTVTVTVDPVNDVPEGVDDTATTDEETLVNIPVVSNDNDADTGDTLTPTNITAPSDGTAVLNADGVTVDYTPNANFTGTDTFTYTPNDGTTDGAVVTVTVTVGGVNDAPVGVDDIATTDEETLVNIPVVSNDNDADVGDTLTPTNITAPSDGTAVLNADGVTIDYTPNANFAGTDTFTYTPNDGTTDGAIVTVTVTVDPVNDAPEGVDDTATTDEETLVNIPVVSNDTDADAGDTLTPTNITTPSDGTAVLNADGVTIDYTPDANFTGTDTFTYTPNDGTTDGAVVTVTVTVNEVNDAPVGVDDTATTDEETLVNIPVVSNDNDEDDGDTLTPTNITAPNDGTAVLNADGVTIDYTPNDDFVGTDTFTYTPNDGVDDGEVVTVTVTVDPVNDAPVGIDDTATTNEEALVNIPVVSNDDDVDAGDTLTPTNITAPANGTADINADGVTIDYTPNANFTGIDTFTYTPNDGTTDGAVVTVTVTVDPVNDIPVATDDGTFTVVPLVTHNHAVLTNDTDDDTNDTLTITHITDPASPTIPVAIVVGTPVTLTSGTVVVLLADGSFDITPAANMSVTETFDYTISDNNGGTDSATVSLAKDTDGDGIEDSIDLDDDNDTIPDTVEQATAQNGGDTDGDGIPDELDLDADGDGISDLQESGLSPVGLATLDPDNDGTVDTTVGANGLADEVETNDTPTAISLHAPADTDGDSYPDFQDLDTDNDGIHDLLESGNADPAVNDANNDGILDDNGTDADQDGIPDSIDTDDIGFGGFANNPVDTDTDSVPDFRDLDSDNDSINDIIEAGIPDAEDDGVADSPDVDTDNDGIPNSVDASPAAYGDPDATALPNADGDNTPDVLDTDSDDDGIPDIEENGLGSLDTNNNGVIDNTTDTDGDGVPDVVDGNPDHFGDEADNDRDGIIDGLDLDDDNDGIPDTVETTTARNGGDTDGDGIKDSFDTDADGDGINDLYESGQPETLLATLDTNDDGVIDTPVGANGLADALESNDTPTAIVVKPHDTDNDSQPNFQDVDSDGDSVPDSLEGENLGVSGQEPDTDNDGAPDYLDFDSDNDGIPDVVESSASGVDTDNDGIDNAFDTDTNPGFDVDSDGVNDDALPDTDNDGSPDMRDLDSDKDGIPDTIEADVSHLDTDFDGIDDTYDVDATSGTDTNSDGVDDNAAPDTDGDTTPDFREKDSDADGIPDTFEGDATGTDTDSDGIDDHFDVDVTGGADIDGDGIDDVIKPSDTDMDGKPDYRDLDADNDGIPDAIEADVTATDEDNDGIDDLYDVDVTGGTDLNGDGIDDSVSPTNTDTDLSPDYRDLDADNDSIPDVAEAGNQDDNFDGLHDNGGTTSTTLPNVDGDILPDYRDTDSDNDGEMDIEEAGSGGLDTNDDGMIDDTGDTDNDGIPNIMDGEVGQFGTSTDSDNDGVANSIDLDDDNDGIPDIAELNANGIDVDTDGDGIADRLDRDSDNDGIPDTIEATLDSVNRDANLDGVVDGFTDQNKDGLHDPVLPGYNPVNTDLTDKPDFRDLDSDNDTLSDHLEASGGIALDPNADGVIDTYVDTDLDGLADSVDPETLNAGNAGKGLTNPDFDKDGARNFRDQDSDNDELSDILEAGNVASNPVGQDTNGNGEPNFLDASEELETAVTGKGGSAGIVGLFMLLLLSLRKRLSHRFQGFLGFRGFKALSRFLPMMLLAVVMMSSSNEVVADVFSQQATDTETESGAMEKAFESSFYGGVGGVYSHVDPEGEANGWRTSQDGDYDAGYQLFGGYHFKPHWFAELGYTDMGKAELDNRIDPRLGKESISYKVPSLHLGYLLRDHDKELNVYGKAGVSVIKNKASAERVPYKSQTSTQLSGGAGVQYQPKETNWFARAGVDVHDRDAVALGLSVGYKFKPAKQEVEEESFPITTPEPVATPAPQPVQVAQAQPRPKPAPRPRKPIDTDGDGFIDSIDDCIHSRRNVVVDGKGCEVKVAKPVFDYVLRGVNFHTNSARLTSSSMHILDDVANTLRQHPHIKVQIVGHTDDRGDRSYNQGLSERRAASVVSYIVSQDVSSHRISSAGRGESQPIATNSTALGRGTNRRVEIREVK